MSIEAICAIITAVCAVLALIGGAIWASTDRFATKAQTEVLNKNLEKMDKRLDEVEDLVKTVHSNYVWYKGEIEKRENLLKNAEQLFNRVESKIDRISA